MNSTGAYFQTSLGKKTVMAVTGLMLLGFVFAHLAGNLQIFLGPNALNAYAEKLRHFPTLLVLARIILLVVAVIHIGLGYKLAIENRLARPVPYKSQNTVAAPLPSRTMAISGGLILSFVIFHLMHFTWGKINPEFFGLKDALGRPDVFTMVVSSFRELPIVAAYLVAIFFLSAHLSHGIGSVFQTFGVADSDHQSWVRYVSVGIAWIVFLGYASIPLGVQLGWINLAKAS